MEKDIEKAIRETLVIGNPQSVKYAVDKIMRLINVEVKEEKVNAQEDLSETIQRLNIRVMNCRSGQGLMSYGYSFIQIGGYAGQSNDDVQGEEIWDGDLSKGCTVLDCRGGKCEKISWDRFNEIIKC